MINGDGHAIGCRAFDLQATNLQSVALVTPGEDLHNNRHQ
jgi:fatty-acid desaturase